jgi:hypothetical protein
MTQPSRRGRRWWQRGDAGAATVEIAGYTTLMLAALLVGVQVVMWGMAALGARYAADQAAQHARQYGATAAVGQTQAQTVLASAVGNALNDATVSVDRTATTVTVVVSGTAVSVIPGFHPGVTATANAPVERVG